MSIYGKKINFKKINLNIIKENWKKIVGLVGIIIILILAITFWGGIKFTEISPIQISWKNNPLNLEKDGHAELTIRLYNNQNFDAETAKIQLVPKNSAIIVYPNEKILKQGLARGEQRETTFIIRALEGQVLKGRYIIEIRTQVGEKNYVSETAIEIEN